MRQIGLVAVIMSVALALQSGCAPNAALPAQERARLDSLDATGVVQAYFEAGDQEVELYLSPPEERDRAGHANYVAETEREAGIENLVIEGGESADQPLERYADYDDQRLFVVTYTSLRQSSIGEPPGMRMYFVYTGRAPADGSWRVLGTGSSP